MKLAAAPLSEREEEEVKENQVISQPGTAVVAMARENQDVIKVPEHLHIGRPSHDPISLEKLHNMAQEANHEPDSSRASTLSRMYSMVSEKISPIYKKAKSLVGIEEDKSLTGIQEQKEAPETNADSQEPKKPKTWREDLGDFVNGFGFKAACSIVIIANSVHLTILSDDQIVSSYNAALHGGQEAEDVHFLDYFFASWFAVEILLRVIARGAVDFYSGKGWQWNCFDTAIALEAVLGLVGRLAGAQIWQLRVLGIFRLARLVKHMKKVKVLRKLRKTLLALVASLVDLFWAFLVVVLFLYVYSIFLSTATVHYFDNLNRTGATVLAGDELVEVQKVQDYYGSIISTMLSLWSDISGGNDWMEYAETLRTMGGTFYFASFIAFIAFCTIGLFNVVTGIFVDSAVEAAAMFRSDAEMIADHQEQKATEDEELNELVGLLGTDAGKYVTSEELDEHLKGPTAQAFWHTKMQLNPHQVKDMHILYSRLKPKTTGKEGVRVEDFLHFTRRCKGQASYVDLLTLMHDQTRLGKFIHREFEEMKKLHQDLRSGIALAIPPMPPPTAPPPAPP